MHWTPSSGPEPGHTASAASRALHLLLWDWGRTGMGAEAEGSGAGWVPKGTLGWAAMAARAEAIMDRAAADGSPPAGAAC